MLPDSSGLNHQGLSAQQSICRLGVMSWQVHHAPLLGESMNLPESLEGYERARAHTVYLLLDQSLLRVARVAREEKAQLTVIDDHGNVARRLAGRRDDR